MIGSTFGLRLLAKPSVQRTVLWVIAVVVLGFRLAQLVRLMGEIQWGYDFSYYWTAARHLLDGQAIYSPAQLAGPYAPQGQLGFLYPPPLAAAVIPLALAFPSEPKSAAWVWLVLGASILAISVLSLWRSERLGDRHVLLAGRGRWLLLAAAFAFPPVVGELVLGNVHLVLLGLLTLAWLGLRRSTQGGELIGGMAVGAAAMVKVFPGVLLLWFLLTRRFRAAVGFVAAAAVLAIVTLPITGLQPWLDYPTVLANLSAPSNTTDTLAPTVWLADVIGFTAARILVTLVGIGLLAWAALRLDAKRSFAVAVMVSILVAPALYHHYLALLVLPLILGLSAGVPLRWLALAYFLMWGGQQQALGDLAWIINRGMPTAGALVLLTGLLIGGRASTEHATSLAKAQAAA
jgi:alpha-1,2-mannosyltransferase